MPIDLIFRSRKRSKCRTKENLFREEQENRFQEKQKKMEALKSFFHRFGPLGAHLRLFGEVLGQSFSMRTF